VTAANRQTARWQGFVFGRRRDVDDPAEAYHEASKVSPSQIGRQMEGARRLEGNELLQLSSSRSVKRYGVAPIPFPAPRPLERPLGEVMQNRRSKRAFAPAAVGFTELATLLSACYGVTGALEPGDARPALALRAVPSAGALYPLELYTAAVRVRELEPGLYHFDPLAPGLELLRAGLEGEELTGLSTYPEIVGSCAVLLFIAAVFGRARFKYGLRSYRFALLEAGHVAQNAVLAATALGLATVPLGAFYDRSTDAILGLDGVNESTLYAIALGCEQA